MTALMLSNIIWGAFCWKKMPLPLTFILGQISIAFTFEIVGQILKHTGHQNAMLFNLYIVLEFILLILVISLLIKKRFATRLTVFLIVIYIGFWGKTIVCNGAGSFAAKVFLLGCLILSCCYFYLMIKISSSKDDFIKQPTFWISLGTTIYFCSVIPLFGAFHYFETHNKQQLGSYLYTINDIMGIIRYSFILYAFYLLKKKNINYNAR